MTPKSVHYFICGIGGSGMLPLAILLKGMGHEISGSDRSYDQGHNLKKFDWIKSQGIKLHPQDGSGVSGEITAVVISKAVEDNVPDIIAAKSKNIPIKLRVDMLVSMFNAAKTRIAISGTSGKTTTTGMIGYILKTAGRDPTVMNGGIFKNYMNENPYSTAFVGASDVFVTEVDESDGVDNVVRYNPDIAVIHNITLDHQPMDELRAMFKGFLEKTNTAILNADDENVMAIANHFTGHKITYSAHGHDADIIAKKIKHRVDGVECMIEGFGESIALSLQVSGRHNISNALAAIGAAKSVGVSVNDSCKILSGFTGIKRRMDVIGVNNGITVMDDFAHNPDKIAATLSTLKEFSGPLHIFFQPHGYGFLKVVGHELGSAFADYMDDNDALYMVDPLYLGGTVDKSVGAKMVVDDVLARGKKAYFMNGRDDVYSAITSASKAGDRIIIMGARDDTLSEFAKMFLN